MMNRSEGYRPCLNKHEYTLCCSRPRHREKAQLSPRIVIRCDSEPLTLIHYEVGPPAFDKSGNVVGETDLLHFSHFFIAILYLKKLGEYRSGTTSRSLSLTFLRHFSFLSKLSLDDSHSVL